MALTTAPTDSPDARDDAAPLRVERAELSRKRARAQTMAEAEGADLEAALKRIAELGRSIADLDQRITDAVAADSRATLAEVARVALLEGPLTLVMGRAVFPNWLPKWEGTTIEKRQALIRDLFGPVVVSFQDVLLTKTNQRITRQKWTPDTWKLDPTQAF
jgi:hypothetical protein